MTTLHDDPFIFYYSWSVPFLYRTLHPFPFSPSSLRLFLYSLPLSLTLLTRLLWYQVTVHLSEIADPDIAKVTKLASLLPTSSTPSSLLPLTTPVETYTWPAYADRCSLSCAHSGIACCDTKLRLNLKMILPYLGSSRITIQSPDLLSNLRTFLPWLRSLLGSLRIYFGSSLDLSDSSLILEIGPSSEILRISRPFAHLGPFPFPLPLTLCLPLPGHQWDSFWLGRLLTRAPYLRWSSYSGFWLWLIIYPQVDRNMYKHGLCAGLCAFPVSIYTSVDSLL